MASQSQNMTTDNGNIVFYQIMTPSSQSIPNNTSTVQVDVWVKRTNSGYSTYGTGTVYSTINGVQYATSITTGQSITDTPIRISSKLVTIAHYSDGTYTLPMSAQITHSSFNGVKQSWSVALATIPRASSVATMGNITVGGNVPVTLAIQSTGFTHDATLYCASTLIATRNVLQAGLTDITFVLTAPEIDLMYTTMASLTTATLTTYVKTMSGATQIGAMASKTSTATIGAGIIPTVASITAGTVNAITGTYIKNVTPITFAMNTIAGANHSTIVSYKINFNGLDYLTSSATTGLLNISGSYTATGTVVDSRGRVSANDTVAVNLLDYSTPTITAFTVTRCDSGGVANVMGTYAKVYTKGSVKSLINSTERNALTYTVFYKLRSSGTWLQAKAPTVSGLAVDLTQTLGTGLYLATASYDWKLEIVDKITLTPIISSVTMSTGAVTMSWGATGVGIGKIYETANGALDVGGNVTVTGNETISGTLAVTGVITAPTAVAGTNTTQVATTAFVQSKANLASPTFTGTVTAPNIIVGASITASGTEVVSSGSNANGDWVKYYDGTLIQYFRTTQSSLGTYSNYAPNVYILGYIWTFPISFYDISIVVNCTEFKWGTGAGFGGTSGEPTVTNVGLRGFENYARATGTAIAISAMAIGRWKA